jgi:uncharacterized protein (DUF433 family)
MARIEIGKYLAADTRVCAGRLIFKGTRILVADALELSQAGYASDDIAAQYRGAIVPAAVREALSLIRKGLVKEATTRA